MKSKLQVVSSMLIFGSIGLFVKNIGLPSSEIAMVRGFIGAAVLVVAALVLRKGLSFRAIGRNLLLLALCGAAIGANWIALFEAYKYTSVSIATLCYYLAPVFVVLLSPLVLKERLTALKCVCVGFALVGMTLIAEVFAPGAEGRGSFTGILLGLAAAVLYASVMLMNRFFKDISPMDATISQLLIAALVLTPYVFLTADASAALRADARSVVLLLVVGVVHTGFAYLMYFSAIPRISAQTVAVMSYIDPITAILLSALVLRESMSAPQIVGAALILGSTLASELIPSLKKGKKISPVNKNRAEREPVSVENGGGGADSQCH